MNKPHQGTIKLIRYNIVVKRAYYYTTANRKEIMRLWFETLDKSHPVEEYYFQIDPKTVNLNKYQLAEEIEN